MSMTKRILFGNDPADDRIREKMREDTQAYLEPFKFKIPTRRRNRLGRGPHWDPFWRSCLTAAADELGIETVQINDQMCTKSQEGADSIKSRADELHQAKIKNIRSIPIPNQKKSLKIDLKFLLEFLS